MVRTNREILTGGKKYAQKQKQKHRVLEVVFDKDSRKEYLTGFHKRKVQRQKNALEYNAEQDRLAKIEERKRIRDEKKEDILRQLDLYNNKLKDLRGIVNESDESDDDDHKKSKSKQNIDDDENLDEWNGFDESNEEEEAAVLEEERQAEIRGILKRKEVYASAPIDSEQDQLTTVTIESMDPNKDNLEIIAKSNFVDLSKSREVLNESIDRAKKYAVIVASQTKPKIKKKKFRYLSKNERKLNVRKEKSKSNSRKKDK